MLQEIRTYLRGRRQASLKDIAVALGSDEQTVRHALRQWQAKSQVRQLPAGTPCRGCQLCASDEIELYEWIGSPVSGAVNVSAEGCARVSVHPTER